MKITETSSFTNYMGYWLRRLSNKIHYKYRDALAENEVTGSQWCVLSTIFNENLHTPIEISRFLEIDSAAMTRLVDRLIAKGLIERMAHKTDRRSIWLLLTDKGKKLTPQLADIGDRIHDDFFSSLSIDELATFRELMIKLLEHNGIETCKWQSPDLSALIHLRK